MSQGVWWDTVHGVTDSDSTEWLSTQTVLMSSCLAAAPLNPTLRQIIAYMLAAPSGPVAIGSHSQPGLVCSRKKFCLLSVNFPGVFFNEPSGWNGPIWFDLAFLFFENRLCAQQYPWPALFQPGAPQSLFHQDFPMNLLLVHRLCSTGVTFSGQ